LEQAAVEGEIRAGFCLQDVACVERTMCTTLVDGCMRGGIVEETGNGEHNEIFNIQVQLVDYQ
jgi:hypothetical protein